MKAMMRGLAAAALVTTATGALAAPTVTSVQIRNIDGIAGDGYLQIAELQIFGGATNYALTGTATATSTYSGGESPSFANDGNVNGGYGGIYHGAFSNGEDVFTLTLAAAQSITRLSIYGRTDCCSNRDIYSYTLLNGATVVGTGTLDARATSFATADVSSVPEPASWAMMIMGFGMIGFGMRYSVRKSNAKFNLKVKRIAAGLEA